MAYDINIKESIEDKKSWFNVKRFKIGNLTFERPVKALDVKGLTTRDFLDVINTHEFQMFETSKMIKNFKIIDSLRNEEEDGKINSFFNKNSSYNFLTSLNDSLLTPLINALTKFVIFERSFIVWVMPLFSRSLWICC